MRLRDALEGIARSRERPKRGRRAGLIGEARMAELSNHAPATIPHPHE
jgi:hypothetical protein